MMSSLGRGEPLKVSVCVITYMHERYIERCLQSIVGQQTSFVFEVIVGVDFSTDRTARIVQQFADDYPTLIKPIFHTERVGGCPNYLAVHLAATGRYVATVDGDDFMLPGKLERQAALLDAHANLSVVWHPMNWVADGDEALPVGLASRADSHIELTLADHVNFGALGAHSSQMYRREGAGLDRLPPEFLDFDINALHLLRGKGALITEAVYGGYQAGVGVSSTDVGAVRRLAETGVLRILQCHPEYRPEASSWSLHMLLHDIKTRSPLVRQSVSMFLTTFSLRGVALYLRTFGRRRAIGRLITGQGIQ